MIVRYLKIFLYFHLFLLVPGCVTLPEYARPRMVPTSQEIISPSPSEGFAYRQLKIAAFDEDTSMIFNPKQQRWWLNKVKKAMQEDQAK